MNRGRKAWKPTEQDRKEIKQMAGFGLCSQQIADIKGVHRATLYKYCKAEMQSGKAIAVLQVAKSAYEMARDKKNPAMTMFWLKTQAGWRQDGPVPGEEEDKKKPPSDPLIEALSKSAVTDWDQATNDE